MSEKLNILWICTDSQRWDTLGCYGNDLDKDHGDNYNLWDTEAYKDIKAELVLRLTDRMAFTCDPLNERIGIF